MSTKENTWDCGGLEVNVGEISIGPKGSTKTASATAGAATLASTSGVVTSESITTAAAGTYTLTLTNTKAVATDIVQATINGGTNTAGTPILLSAVPSAGSIVFKIYNAHSANAFNGTLAVGFNIVRGL